MIASSQDPTTKVWAFDVNGDHGDHVSTSYNRLGRTTSTTDQRGVVHAYAFDTAGRLVADTVDLGNVGEQNVEDKRLVAHRRAEGPMVHPAQGIALGEGERVRVFRPERPAVRLPVKNGRPFRPSAKRRAE